MLKFRDQVALLPAYRGDMRIERLNGEDSVGAKIAVRGAQIRSQWQGEDFTQQVAYDGKRIRMLDEQKRIVYVNEPDQIGRSLFDNVQSLVFWPFTSNEQIAQEYEADSTNYAGAAVVAGIPCHIVYTRRNFESSRNETWWFLSLQDYLPRKVIRQFGGVPGQERIEITTITDLNTNIEIDPAEFILEAPQDFEVKIYEGFGTTSTPGLAAGSMAPDWTLPDPAGNLVSLDELRGNVVLMDFWATWCGPCIAAMPELQELHERFGD